MRKNMRKKINLGINTANKKGGIRNGITKLGFFSEEAKRIVCHIDGVADCVIGMHSFLCLVFFKIICMNYQQM